MRSVTAPTAELRRAPLRVEHRAGGLTSVNEDGVFGGLLAPDRKAARGVVRVVLNVDSQQQRTDLRAIDLGQGRRRGCCGGLCWRRRRIVRQESAASIGRAAVQSVRSAILNASVWVRSAGTCAASRAATPSWRGSVALIGMMAAAAAAALPNPAIRTAATSSTVAPAIGHEFLRRVWSVGGATRCVDECGVRCAFCDLQAERCDELELRRCGCVRARLDACASALRLRTLRVQPHSLTLIDRKA